MRTFIVFFLIPGLFLIASCFVGEYVKRLAEKDKISAIFRDVTVAVFPLFCLGYILGFILS
jgi:hypothetical protein